MLVLRSHLYYSNSSNILFKPQKGGGGGKRSPKTSKIETNFYVVLDAISYKKNYPAELSRRVFLITYHTFITLSKIKKRTSDIIIWPAFKSKWWTKITPGFIRSVSEYHIPSGKWESHIFRFGVIFSVKNHIFRSDRIIRSIKHHLRDNRDKRVGHVIGMSYSHMIWIWWKNVTFTLLFFIVQLLSTSSSTDRSRWRCTLGSIMNGVLEWIEVDFVWEIGVYEQFCLPEQRRYDFCQKFPWDLSTVPVEVLLEDWGEIWPSLVI